MSARDAYLEKTLNQFITNEMKNAKLNQIFVTPFNLGYHWVLVVIDYNSMKVFSLDSLHRKPNLEFKLYMDTGLRALVVNGKRMPSPTWEYIKGLHQLGSIECGFYVLKFMKELIEDPYKSIEAKMKQLVGKEMYENHEIYELQNEFIQAYMIEFGA